jgi:hypothetical protein
MKSAHWTLGLIAAAGLASAANGQVIISEIMANPNGTDVPGEWIEIFNPTDSPVDISGWFFQDEDGGSSPSEPFPEGYIIEAGEAIVIIGSAAREGTSVARITDVEFYASWGNLNAAGQPYRVYVQQAYLTYANTASPTNEVLGLYNEGGILMDLANYENGTNGWPQTISGKSVYVAEDFLDEFSNDVGCAWRLAALGLDGVVTSAEVQAVNPLGNIVTALTADNLASPGYAQVGTGTFADCNNNGYPDALDICDGISVDCNGNGVPDECEPDCNNNGIADECDIREDYLLDTNLNNELDSCEIAANPALDQNGNGLLDSYEALAGKMIISEIMFNPWTTVEELEYVEIYNTTSGPIDISGYYFRDIEPGGDPATDAVPAGTIIPAGGIAVLTRSVTGDVNETRQTYIDAWGANTPAGDPILWIPLENWGARATNGTPFAEILTLISGSNTIVDIANYVHATSNNEPLPGGWPGSDDHSSYYLDGTKLNAVDNDFGPNWRSSIEGLSGAYRSNPFDANNPPSWTDVTRGGEDYGTPGFIYMAAPQEPTGTVIITEIMASANAVFPGEDPNDVNAAAGVDEWVEIYNTTNAPINIGGWYLQDEDGRTTGLPLGATLAAGEVAVIVGDDFPTEVPNPIQAFYDAWGCGYQVFAVSNWYVDNEHFGLGRLSNSPNFINEILRIVDASGTPVDIVNFDDDGFNWPVDANGFATDDAWSIYIQTSGNYNSVANDDGFSWADSLAPIDGARIALPTTVYNALANTYGSPGHLQGVQVPDLNDCSIPPCNAADLAEPYGTLNFFDVSAFLGAYNTQNPAADLAEPFGTFNFFDVSTFLGVYNAGCP